MLLFASVERFSVSRMRDFLGRLTNFFQENVFLAKKPWLCKKIVFFQVCFGHFCRTLRKLGNKTGREGDPDIDFGWLVGGQRGDGRVNTKEC